jgi:hypothetical protein
MVPEEGTGAALGAGRRSMASCAVFGLPFRFVLEPFVPLVHLAWQVSPKMTPKQFL